MLVLAKGAKALALLVIIFVLSTTLIACNGGKEFALDLNHLELDVGATAVLKAQEESDDLDWSSSDTKVVQVDQLGNVKAVGPGVAVITVRAGEKTATCNVVVNEPETVLQLNWDSLWIGLGETRQIIASPSEGTTVVWASEDSGIAQVDQSGKITAVAPGTTNVIASIGEEIAECEVIVFGINLDSFLVIGGSIQAQVLSPKSISGSLVWTSSNSEIAKVDQSGNVFGVGLGTVIITAAIDGGMAECEVIVSGTSPIDIILGVGETQPVQITPLPEGEKAVWRSMNTDIAKVDQSGNVTAVAMGSTDIVASIAGREAVCRVSVATNISDQRVAEIRGLISSVESFSPDGKMFVSSVGRVMASPAMRLMDLEGNAFDLPCSPLPYDETGFGPVSWRESKLVYSAADHYGSIPGIYIYDTKDHSYVNIAESFNWDRYVASNLNPVFRSEDIISVLMPDNLWNYDLNKQSWSHVHSFQEGERGRETWSPDFSKVAWAEYDLNNESIVVLDVQSGEARKVFKSNIAGFAWSEDSTRLAVLSFQCDRSLNKVYYPLSVIDMDGKVIKSFQDPGNTFLGDKLNTTVSWVPGQNKIAYNTEDGLVIRDVTNGTRWLIAPPIPSPGVAARENAEYQGVELYMQHTWLENGDLAISNSFAYHGPSYGIMEIYSIDWEKWNSGE